MNKDMEIGEPGRHSLIWIARDHAFGAHGKLIRSSKQPVAMCSCGRVYRLERV